MSRYPSVRIVAKRRERRVDEPTSTHYLAKTRNLNAIALLDATIRLLKADRHASRAIPTGVAVR